MNVNTELRVNVVPGIAAKDACADAIRLANILGVRVLFVLNSIEMCAEADSDVTTMVGYFQSKVMKRGKERKAASYR